jgi:hypothetical protein
MNNDDLLQFYIRQYQITSNRIEYLYQNLDELRSHINYLYDAQYISVQHPNANINNSRSRTYPLHRTFSRSRRNHTTANASTNIHTNTNNSLSRLNMNLFESISDYFDAVPVAPSTHEIANATSIKKFEDIENPLNNSCPIRCEDFQPTDEVIQINECQHIFFKEELLHWFQSNVRCPVCRLDIRGNSASFQTGNTSSNSQTTDLVNSNSTEQELANQLLQILYGPLTGRTSHPSSSSTSSPVIYETYVSIPRTNNRRS